MGKVSKASWMLASVAAITFIAPDAYAATPKEKELEARVEALERAFGSMAGQLQTSQAENAQLRAALTDAQTKVSEVQTAVQTVQTVQAAKPAPAPDGFTVGGGSTRIKLGGFIKTIATFSRWDDGDVAQSSLGRDFYLPQAIPVGGVRESTDADLSAKHTRLWMNLEQTVAGHVVKGYVETDFQTAAGTQGSERTTNGYDLALRRAYVQLDKLTVGQDWTTFQNVATLPESTDFVGTTEGTVFVRQPLVRYSTPLSKAATLHLSVENPETSTANLGSPTLIENDDDRMPDFAARLNYMTSIGEISVAGLVRQLSVDNGAVHDQATAYGASVAGKVFLDKAKRYDLRFMASYGSGIARYLGLNFAPDAVFVPATSQLHKVESFAGFAALRLGWTPSVRSTVMASYQNADYAEGFAAGSFNSWNDKAWSVAGNLFWSPVKSIDLGVEYRHGERALVSGASGQLDRFEFAAKFNF